MAKYLDDTGLSYFWSKIKTRFAAASHSHAASDITSGTLAAARGGTGESTLKNSANALINALGSGDSDVTDDDTCIVCQNVDPTLTTYFRRPVSKLWSYIKGKADSVYAALIHYHGYLYNNASTADGISNSLHRMYVSALDNLIIQNRADSSSSWGNEKYAAITSSAPSNSAQQAANKVLATPNGSTGYPSMRALVAADLPTVPATKGGTGQTSLGNSMDALVDSLSASATIPNDNDCFVEQYYTTPSSGTRCSKRPMTALWNYVKSKIDSIYGLGTVVEDSDSGVSATSATATNISQVTLSAGTWIVSYSATFASNATGRRNMRIATSSTSTAASMEYSMIVPAANGAQTILGKTVVLVLTASQTWYLNAMQNSGSTLDCSGVIRAVRIA